MATEAVAIEVYGVPVIRNVADGTTISKGTLLKLADANLASIATGVGEAFGGIAASDKVASDGSTTLGCYMSGVWDITGAVITAGKPVRISGALNYVEAALAADLLTGAVVGTAEESATSSEVIRVRLIGI